MNQLDEAVEQLIEVIRASEDYQEYRRQLEKVKQYPELKEKIDEFRRRNFELQCSPDYAFDKMEQFELEYRELRDDPLVSDFLAAELAFCRLMQHVSGRIVEAVDFE